MCFVFIWEQTATCVTYSINWLVFITEMKSVYSAVRTGSLNKAVCALSLKVNIATTERSAHTVFMCFVFMWEQTVNPTLQNTNWLVFTTEMKSVYSAVQIGSLNKAVCVSSVNPTSHVMHQQFNIQQLYALPTLYLCVLYLSENKQRLVPLTA